MRKDAVGPKVSTVMFPMDIDEKIQNVKISKKGWKKMQNKEFRKLVIKKFGRPNNDDVKYVNFLLTEKHALIEIVADKVTHKIINAMLNQYKLGYADDTWIFIESRAEFQPIKYWFGGDLVEAEELIVRSFYRTDRIDAIDILQKE
jgi:hypothetical protein